MMQIFSFVRQDKASVNLRFCKNKNKEIYSAAFLKNWSVFQEISCYSETWRSFFNAYTVNGGPFMI
jgi:hypothetical protein